MPPDDEPEDSYTLIDTGTGSIPSVEQIVAVNDVFQKIRECVLPEQVIEFFHEKFHHETHLDLNLLVYLHTNLTVSPVEYQEPLKKEVDNVILRFYMAQIREIQRLIQTHAPAHEVVHHFESLFHKDLPLPLNTVQHILAVMKDQQIPQEYHRMMKQGEQNMIFQYYEHHVQTLFEQIKTKDSPEQVANAFVSLLGSKVPLSLPILQYLISAMEELPIPYRLTLMEKLVNTEQCHVLWNIAFFKDAFRRLLHETLQQTGP